MLPFLQTSGGGGSSAGSALATNNAGFFPSRIFNPLSQTYYSNAYGPGATGALNNTRLYKFVLPFQITVATINYQVQTTSASDKWGFGIYNAGGTTLLVDSGVISPTAGGTFAVTLGSPVLLTPGTYMFAYNQSGGTATTYADWDVSQMETLVNKSGVVKGKATNNSSGGQLPATTGTLIVESDNVLIPLVYFAS